MSVPKLHEKVYQEIEQLSDQQLMEVLLFVEFLNMREDKDFVEYVNSRTLKAVNDRKKGSKFYGLEELQKEFLES